MRLNGSPSRIARLVSLLPVAWCFACTTQTTERECEVAADCAANEACSSDGACLSVEPDPDAGPAPDGGAPAGRLIRVDISPAALHLAVGEERLLLAIGEDEAGESRSVTADCVWSSASPGIASIGNGVGDKGLLRGVAPGTSLITATCDSTLVTTATVVISTAVALSLEPIPAGASLPLEARVPLRAALRLADQRRIDVTPWTVFVSGDPAVASIDDGQVVAASAGTASVAATFGELEAQIDIAVAPEPAAALRLEPAAVSVGLGARFAVEAIVTYGNGIEGDATDLVTFDSDAADLAAVVVLPGHFDAVGEGVTTLSASLGTALSASTAVTVAPAALADIRTRNKHALARTSDGRVLAWGWNESGQLGLGDQTNRGFPVAVSALDDVRVLDVAAGGEHSLFVDDDGAVWAAGRNDLGQLGTGGFDDAPAPSPMPVGGDVPLAGAAEVVAGFGFSLARLHDGRVFAWGENGYGQLGHGDVANRAVPAVIEGLPAVRQIAAGAFHAAAIDEDGDVWVWGYNEYGQLGNGLSIPVTVPILLTAPAGADAVHVAAGWGHTVVQSADGSVFVFGWNDDGQLGTGDLVGETFPAPLAIDAARISAAFTATSARSSTGDVVAWGFNGFGQLGDASQQSRPSPGPVLGPGAVGQLSDVVLLVGGGDQFYAVTGTGQVYAWGRNEFGELGDGTFIDRSAPVLVGGL